MKNTLKYRSNVLTMSEKVTAREKPVLPGEHFEKWVFGNVFFVVVFLNDVCHLKPFISACSIS